MKLNLWSRVNARSASSWLLCASMVVAAVSLIAEPAHAQRVFGLDTSSAANFDVSQPQWNAAYNSGYAPAGISSFQFAIVRSTHGGTNGMSPASDDAQFYQNITRATNAGMLAGSYHYPHANVYTALDEAQHYVDYAGMYMKPGYLLPVFDLEGKAGLESGVLSQADLTKWSNDFIDAIYAATGVNPIVYTSSSYNTDEVTAAVAFTNIAGSPHTGERTYQWLARPSGNLLTGDPVAANTYPDPYGGWDPLYTTKGASTDPAVKPWAFWQNGSAHIDPSGPGGYQFLIDFDAANGNIEFVRDFLVPALWTNAGSGDWGTIANWNSDNPAYTGAIENGPAPRLPGYDATNSTLANRKYDWVKLQNTDGGTVTISSGAQAVRKFYTQQPLNITGGSLTVNYIPGSGGKWDVPSEFNDTVTLSTGASYTAHTTQVDGANTLGTGLFNVNGGTVSFRDMQLASHASTSGRIVMGGDATFGDFNGTGTAVIRSTGSLAQAGRLDLGAATRTLTINNGSAAVDVSIQTAVIGTGGLAKSGAGTLQLTGTNTYSGGTTVNSGILRITKDANLGATPGGFQSSNIILNGGTIQTGSEITSLSLGSIGSGYTSFPSVSFGGAGPDAVAPTANVLGKISSIQVTSGGSGYSGTAKVVLVGGGGTGATATAVMSGGAVTAINITNQGTGYTSVPTVYITDGSGQGVAGDGAAAVVNGIIFTGLSLTSPGFDYASPTVTLTGGGGSGASGLVSSTPNLTLSSNRGISLTGNGGTLNQTAGTTLTIGGVISSTGSGALTKSGAGTLVLSGANTYTGNTAITGGVLQYTTSANLGAASNSIVFDGGTLRTMAADANARNVTVNANDGTIDTNGFDSTFSGVFSGSGDLTKIGAGVLTLSNDSTHTGMITVSSGILQIGNGGSAGSLVASIVNNSEVVFNRANDLVYAGAISGGGTLTKVGVGTLIFTGANSYSGGTTIFSGAIQIGNGGTTGSLSAGSIANEGQLVFKRSDAISFNSVITGSGGVTQTGSGAVTLANGNTYAGDTTINSGVLAYGSNSSLGSTSNSIVFGGGTLRSLAGGTQARNVVLNSGGGTIDTNGFNIIFSGLFSGSSGLTKIGGGTLTLTNSNTYTGATTVSTGTLQIGNGIATGTLASPSIVNNSALIFSGNSSTTYAGVVSGSGTFAKSGSATVSLTGDNTYVGTTTISAGTLQIGDGGTTGSLIGSNSIGNSGNLSFNRSDDSSYGGVISGSGTLTKLGAGKHSLTGANTYTGVTTISAGTLEIGNGGTTGSIADTGGIVNNSALIFNRSNSYSYGGVIGGSGSVTQAGSGVLSLTNTNSYAGNTILNSGILAYSTSANLGLASNAIVFGGGTLRTLAAGTQARNTTLNAAGGTIDTNGFDSSFSGSASGAGGLTKIGAGTLALTNNNSYLGVTTISAGTLQVGGGGTAGSLTSTGGIVDNSNLAFNRGDASSYGGVISGTGTLTKLSSGTHTLTGTNTYTGVTTISAGTLQIGNGGTTGSLAGTGGIVDNSNLAFNRSNDTTYSGIISGSGTLTKLGGGKHTLTGANTYAGATTVSAGTLEIGNGGTNGSLADAGGIVNNSALVFNRSNTYTYGGVISGSGDVTHSGSGTLTLTNTNSYAGNTIIDNGVLAYNASANLGSASNTIVFDGGTLRTLAADTQARNLTLGVAGGTIDTNGFDSTFSGNASGAGGLTKIGTGTLILAGASPSNYSGLTHVFDGRLIIEKDGALGAAGSDSGTTGNTFQLADSASTIAFRDPGSSGVTYATFEVINTHGTGAPGLGQVDNLGGDNTFAGRIALDGPESGGARQVSIGVSSGSLNLTGGLYARGNDGTPRNITKLGAGTLRLSGDGGDATGDALVVPLAASSFSINAGTVELHGPTDTTTNLPGVTTWNVAAGGTLNAASGKFITSTVTVDPAGQFLLTGGSLSVNTINGDLTNQAGVLTPGSSPGGTAIVGNYTQQNSGSLKIEIGGTVQGTDFDFVSVSGVASLDGLLDVSLVNGYAPILADTFTILTSGSLLGSLSNVANGERLAISNGIGSFVVNYGAGSAFDPNNLVLSAFAPPHPYGDYNDDGTVDSADYVVYRKFAGTSQLLPNDATPNFVDTDDYDTWVKNYGQVASGGGGFAGGGSGGGFASRRSGLAESGGTVPEPATILLLLTALAAWPRRK